MTQRASIKTAVTNPIKLSIFKDSRNEFTAEEIIKALQPEITELIISLDDLEPSDCLKVSQAVLMLPELQALTLSRYSYSNDFCWGSGFFMKLPRSKILTSLSTLKMKVDLTSQQQLLLLKNLKYFHHLKVLHYRVDTPYFDDGSAPLLCFDIGRVESLQAAMSSTRDVENRRLYYYGVFEMLKRAGKDNQLSSLEVTLPQITPGCGFAFSAIMNQARECKKERLLIIRIAAKLGVKVKGVASFQSVCPFNSSFTSFIRSLGFI